MRTRTTATRATRRALLTALSAGAAALPLTTGERGTAHANLPAATPKRGYANGPFGLVHYYDNGAPKGRPLLMFHQAPMSARQFDKVYIPLAKRGIRAIGVDMPGFGMSDVTSFVPRCEDWARVAPAVLDHLKIQRADVLGHHTGAMTATEVAVQFPQRVTSLVVNGPMPMGPEERKERLERLKPAEIDYEYEHDGSHMASSFMGRYRMYAAGLRGSWDPSKLPPPGTSDGGPLPDPKLITRYAVEKFMGFGPFWYGHHAAFQYDHGAGLTKVKVRTLLLTNTGDQIYEHCEVARKLRPDFEYAELKGGGIDIVDQMPEEWSEVVATFLAGAPA